MKKFARFSVSAGAVKEKPTRRLHGGWNSSSHEDKVCKESSVKGLFRESI
jgi:hypothetical protein